MRDDPDNDKAINLPDMITGPADLAAFCCVEIENIDEAIYRQTSCGAQLTLNETGIKLEAIIEESDAIAGPVELDYPFTFHALRDAIQFLETHAEKLWQEANGDPGVFAYPLEKVQ